MILMMKNVLEGRMIVNAKEWHKKQCYANALHWTSTCAQGPRARPSPEAKGTVLWAVPAVRALVPGTYLSASVLRWVVPGSRARVRGARILASAH